MEKDYLLKKWLNDDLTEEERRAFESHADFEINDTIIKEGQRFKASHFSIPASFDAVEERISHSKPIEKKMSWKYSLLKIASVVVLGVAVYFTFFNNALSEIRALATEQKEVELPDHSKVVLNSDSELSFDAKEWKKQRIVSLKGEAFFRVAKGKTFDVETSAGTVTVVGTQFNVNHRKTYFEVICYEGIVQVKSKDTLLKLLAGDSFRTLNGVVSVGKTKENAPPWTQHMSTFKDVPYSLVLDELERQYGVSIDYPSAYRDQLFSGGFVQNNLENALQSITAPFGLTYQITDTNIRLFKG